MTDATEIPDGRWRPEAEGPGYVPVRYLRRGRVVVRQVRADDATGEKLVFHMRMICKAACQGLNMEGARR